MYISSFNVILGNNEKKVIIQNNTSTLSDNMSILTRYVLDLGGNMINNNTASFLSKDAFVEFINKVLEF
jgi:hypothetical protein